MRIAYYEFEPDSKDEDNYYWGGTWDRLIEDRWGDRIVAVNECGKDEDVVLVGWREVHNKEIDKVEVLKVVYVPMNIPWYAEDGDERSKMYFKYSGDVDMKLTTNYDLVLVPTESMRKYFYRYLGFGNAKVEVLREFVDVDSIKYKKDKEKLVVYAGRLNWDRGPGNLLVMRQMFPKDWDLVILNDRDIRIDGDWMFVDEEILVLEQLLKAGWRYEIVNTKQKYYDRLGDAKVIVSGSDKEVFGVAVMEGVVAGAIPIVPDKFSFRELYSRKFRYGNWLKLKSIIDSIVKGELRLTEDNVRWYRQHYNVDSVLCDLYKMIKENLWKEAI